MSIYILLSLLFYKKLSKLSISFKLIYEQWINKDVFNYYFLLKLEYIFIVFLN